MAVQERASDETTRRHVHGSWAAVAEGWGERADEVDARGAAVARWMVERSGPRRGDRVLEVACGPGGLGLAVADLVGPHGEVVVSDVVPEMAAIAARRAADRGLVNVRAATLDLEAIDEPDAAYDVVLCREGLMFAVEPVRGAREIHRVLRRDGRFAVAVWGPRAENPWLQLVFDALGAQLGRPVPPPGVPGPFSLDDPTRLRDLLTDAGFTDVVLDTIPTPLRAPSFDAWWTRTAAIAGPVATIVAGLPEPARAALAARLRRAVDPYTTASGVELPGLSLVACARRRS